MKIENYDKVTELIKELNSYMLLLENINNTPTVMISKNNLDKHKFIEVTIGFQDEFYNETKDYVDSIRTNVNKRITELRNKIEGL